MEDYITQIRHSVFETNSSSSHSVVIGGTCAKDFGLTKEELRSGKLDLNVSYFSKSSGDGVDNNTKKKLATLLSVCGVGMGEWDEELDERKPSGSTMDDWRNDANAKKVIDVFESITGMKIESISISDYLESESAFERLIQDPELVEIYLFSPNSGYYYSYD